GRYVSVGASDTRHGVTVTVRGIVAGAEQTALDLIALGDGPETRVGIGGMEGLRDASTALTLRDDASRTFIEQFRQDARDQFPDPSGIAAVAIFEALPDDASELELDVPSIVIDDPRPTLDIDLPVESPREVEFGPYGLRIRGSRAGEVRRGPRGPVPTVALDVDLGHVEDELCLLKPWRVNVDGQPGGFGFGVKGIYAP